MLFNNRLLSTVGLLNDWQAFRPLTLISFSLLHGLEGPLLLLCLLQFLVNVDVGGGADDAATLYPVAGVGYEVVRVVLTELVRAGLKKLVLYIYCRVIIRTMSFFLVSHNVQYLLLIWKKSSVTSQIRMLLFHYLR